MVSYKGIILINPIKLLEVFMLDTPLALRFATEIDSETAAKEAQEVKTVSWDPSIERKIQIIVATGGSTTTKKTFQNQWDSGEFD